MVTLSLWWLWLSCDYLVSKYLVTCAILWLRFWLMCLWQSVEFDYLVDMTIWLLWKSGKCEHVVNITIGKLWQSCDCICLWYLTHISYWFIVLSQHRCKTAFAFILFLCVYFQCFKFYISSTIFFINRDPGSYIQREIQREIQQMNQL